MNDYGPRENWPETRASERAHEIHDEAQARLRHEQFPALLLSILTPSPQELDAIAKMEKDLLAKLGRANKIDQLREELRQKAEELRALADSPNEPLTDAKLDRMLADLAHDREFESRSYPAKPSMHDE